MQTGSTLSATAVHPAADVVVVLAGGVALGAAPKSNAARMIVIIGGFLQESAARQ